MVVRERFRGLFVESEVYKVSREFSKLLLYFFFFMKNIKSIFYFDKIKKKKKRIGSLESSIGIRSTNKII